MDIWSNYRDGRVVVDYVEDCVKTICLFNSKNVLTPMNTKYSTIAIDAHKRIRGLCGPTNYEIIGTMNMTKELQEWPKMYSV